jgi:pectate lyase
LLVWFSCNPFQQQNQNRNGSTFNVLDTSDAARATGGNAAYDLIGFANGTTGGGDIATTDPAFAKVTTPQAFLDALYSWMKGKAYGAYTVPVKVIDIAADLNLGYTEVGSSVTSSTSGGLLSAAATPKLHPVLLATGVSKLDIKTGTGLTIYSENASTIKHCTFNVKSTSNIIIRNLKFDELWEWDESSKGNYDENDWDFITIGNGGAVNNLWVDHCTFTKAYDGIADVKDSNQNITFSWNKITGDDGATNSNSFVRQQFNYLEQSSSSYPMYNWLRTHGFSIDDLVLINQGHDKTHLLGQNDLDSNNATIRVTFNHEWYQNVWDRNPARLRAGDVHVINCFADDTVGLAARNLRDTRIAAMAAADQVKLNGSSTTSATYHMGVFLNGTISTENGATQVENSIYWDCLYPLRNNQTDVTNSAYTGKIQALNSEYHMDSPNPLGIAATDITGNSTSNQALFGPNEAPVIAFSWNSFSSLPYSYTLDSTASLKSILASGCGAGTVSIDWMATSY